MAFTYNYPSLQLVVTLSVLPILTVVIYRRYFSPLRHIPGPALASISRLWQVSEALKGKQNVAVHDLHKRYGPFVRIAPNEISVSHPEAPKKLLLASLEKGPWYKVVAVPDWTYPSPFCTTDPEEKKRRSRMFAQGYTLSNLLRSEQHIDGIVASLTRWLDKFAEESTLVELDNYFAYTTFDIAGEVMFSESFGFIAAGRDIDSALVFARLADAFASTIGQFPWIFYLFANPLVTWLRVLPLGHLFDTSMRAVKEREKDPDARFDMIAHWFRSLRGNSHRMTIRDIHAQVSTSIGAGAHTVSSGLQSFFYHMIRHPVALRRVRDEIRKAQAEGKCLDTVISYADSQSLDYLQACIKESLRVFGAIGAWFPRVAPPGGVTIGDLTFPGGTILSVHPYTMHFDKNCWGADAEEFIPERWLSSDIASKEQYWLVFGLGYASCPGQNLARIELSKITATLVRDYNFRQQDPEQEWKIKAYFGIVPYDWPCYVSKVSK
ncbi:cytochrome P450 [Xylariales sp. PMI_506]|nr:cytochrome P450 [Xylariales sp. PMI_506]